MIFRPRFCCGLECEIVVCPHISSLRYLDAHEGVLTVNLGTDRGYGSIAKGKKPRAQRCRRPGGWIDLLSGTHRSPDPVRGKAGPGDQPALVHKEGIPDSTKKKGSVSGCRDERAQDHWRAALPPRRFAPPLLRFVQEGSDSTPAWRGPLWVSGSGIEHC